jgi:hypothetical protein
MTDFSLKSRKHAPEYNRSTHKEHARCHEQSRHSESEIFIFDHGLIPFRKGFELTQSTLGQQKLLPTG